MKSKVIIVAVVVLIAAVAYWKFTNSKDRAGITTLNFKTIPEGVEKHLRDFSEGEKMLFEGKAYQVSNGAGVAR